MNDFEYIAFISYKREDEEWAKRLQKKLESYSMPTALRKENPDLPDKVRPVFRDQSDLSGGNLKKSIEDGLENSKYLIVICSPQTAKSPWVSREVQYFIDHGREEYIIPFIIDGTPNAKNEEDECFPVGLRQLSGEKEILGININEMGRDAAVIKVIARMFGIRFDSLWQRHERAKRRKRFGWGAAAVAVIMFMGVVMQIINAERNKAIEQEKIAIEQREKAETERKRADAQTVIARQERDKVLRANKLLLVTQDSLKISNENLALALNNLNTANIQLNIEKNNILLVNKNLKNQIFRTAIAKIPSIVNEQGISCAYDSLELLSRQYSPLSQEQSNTITNQIISLTNKTNEDFYLQSSLEIKEGEIDDMCLAPNERFLAVASWYAGCVNIIDLFNQ